MTRQELIRFLDREAEQALVTVFPRLLKEIETKLAPRLGVYISVPMGAMLSNYKDPNLQTVIINKLVKKLEELGYTAHGKTEEGEATIVVG